MWKQCTTASGSSTPLVPLTGAEQPFPGLPKSLPFPFLHDIIPDEVMYFVIQPVQIFSVLYLLVHKFLLLMNFLTGLKPNYQNLREGLYHLKIYVISHYSKKVLAFITSYSRGSKFKTGGRIILPILFMVFLKDDNAPN